MSAFVRALRVGAAAVALAGGCYDYADPGKVEAPSRPERDAGVRDAPPSPPRDAQRPDDDAADGTGSGCPADALQCGDKLALRGDTVYRCTDAGTGEVVERCANGCVNGGCNPPTACHPGGQYCGGDKINGDPDVLYRCVDGGAPSVIERCPNGCRINPGVDDSCQ